MKQEYIKMRNSGKYNINWFYRYFIENGGQKINLDVFNQVFNMGNFNDVLRNLDSKFNLNKLEDNKGNLIKIVE